MIPIVVSTLLYVALAAAVAAALLQVRNRRKYRAALGRLKQQYEDGAMDGSTLFISTRQRPAPRQIVVVGPVADLPGSGVPKKFARKTRLSTVDKCKALRKPKTKKNSTKKANRKRKAKAR